MGTDWRDINPEFEPFVEIYQGHRQSYEYLGAPRVGAAAGRVDRRLAAAGHGLERPGHAVPARLPGLERPHLDPHQLRGRPGRGHRPAPAILDAFRRRHCYAATDNIIMDVRSGEHLMGDEFDADGPVKLKVLVHGTAPDRAGRHHQGFPATSTRPSPRTQQVAFEWTDDEKGRPGRPELVLRPGDPGRRRARLGQPDLGASAGIGCERLIVEQRGPRLRLDPPGAVAFLRSGRRPIRGPVADLIAPPTWPSATEPPAPSIRAPDRVKDSLPVSIDAGPILRASTGRGYATVRHAEVRGSRREGPPKRPSSILFDSASDASSITPKREKQAAQFMKNGA